MDITSDVPGLEFFPGALCRVDLASGRVIHHNASAGTLLGRSRSLLRLLGRADYEALVAGSGSTRFWAERACGTMLGRLRVRLKRIGDGDEALVALDVLAPGADSEHLDALLDLVADLRWEWDLAAGRAYHYGPGLLTSDLGDEGLPSAPLDLLTVVHPDDRDAVRAAVEDHLEGRSPHLCCEYRITRGSPDAWRWVESRGCVVERDSDGRALQVAGLTRDITALRAAEAEQAQLADQVRHMQKLDALGQLTGGIAHDFNNILASVLGYAELGAMALEQGDGAVHGEQLQRRLDGYLAEIRGAADRGRELIAKMLVFSRGGAAQGGQEEGVAPLSLIEDTVRMLRPMLPATLAVRLCIDPQMPAVAIDPTQLQQLLLNLVINARDAVGENGTVTIGAKRPAARRFACASCARPVEVTAELVEITVADDGPGIPPALREKIFDPFFTTKEVGRGSGLGLSVVHGIVHEHGGHLGLETSEDGTAITLLLPPAELPATEQEERTSRDVIDGRGRRLLIVDDEAPITRWMAALFEAHGFVADVYLDPLQALRRFRMTPDHWDLVITDQAMPGLSGVELADELLATSPELPVIICSGYSEFVEASNAADFGFHAFLEKPVSGRRLLETVVSVLEPVPRARTLRVVG
ncbi:MAG: ATP-binding protein [Pseudomonadales bacterium]|jgi:signal transduction histidine kinase/ActR/RegA family two-component response regulator|nr:ATP-binding protein [Pseudomonadales bacterium]